MIWLPRLSYGSAAGPRTMTQCPSILAQHACKASAHQSVEQELLQVGHSTIGAAEAAGCGAVPSRELGCCTCQDVCHDVELSRCDVVGLNAGQHTGSRRRHLQARMDHVFISTFHALAGRTDEVAVGFNLGTHMECIFRHLLRELRLGQEDGLHCTWGMGKKGHVMLRHQSNTTNGPA